ncbi:hypothetical protein [Rhizobium sp. 11_C7_N12_5]|jgi:hypothetical protein|uniref:hypothetical protein n=1 Tax=Rhizobium sp. 11_C7_N12_5 TaxID=3240770 RepID=UPI000A880B3B
MVLKNMEIFRFLSIANETAGELPTHPIRSLFNISRRLTMAEPLKLYRLVPIAADDDPNWLNAKSHGEVLVAARTSGDARIVASERELDFMDIDAAPAEDKTTNMASVFRNEKLYTVIEVDNGKEYHQRGVVDGTISVDTVISTQV